MEKALTYDPEATEVAHRENKGVTKSKARKAALAAAAALAAEKAKEKP